MDKKLLIILTIIGFLLFLAFSAVIFLKFRQASSLISPIVNSVEKKEAELAIWEDAAGFSFAYPEKIEIDPHEEDEENYTHLELASFDHPGGIIIWVKETDYSKIEDWVQQEAVGGGQILDSELGGQPAKKIAYSGPAKLVTAAIDVDALVLVEMTPDGKGYWQEVYDQVIDSFVFVPLEGEPAYAEASADKEGIAPGPWEGEGGTGGIIEEAEEVIE